MASSPQRPLRIAIYSDGATGMCLAERLVSADSSRLVYVDLISSRTAPSGLLFASGTPAQAPGAPRLRLVGNVRLDIDVTLDELHELYDAVVTPDAEALVGTDPATLTDAAITSAEITVDVFPGRSADTPPKLVELLTGRGVAVTTWSGWSGSPATADWAALELAARGVPVCM